MKSSWFKQALPHIYAIALFLIIAVIYCQPALQGKVLEQHDIIGWKGMAQQSFEYRESHGHFPLWTNSMFSGMPAYTIAYEGTPVQTILLQHIFTLGLPVPISFFFLACVAFYFLCMVFRLNPVIGAFAAIAYAYSTFDPIIIAVGHNTQMMAIAYAPAVIASLLLIYQKKYLAGGTLLALFFGLQVSTQHIQVVYYTTITMGLISIAYLVQSARDKQVKNVLPGFGIALLAGLVGLGTFAVTWLPLQEYAKETMRGGKSEITKPEEKGNKTKDGLDKDYAFGWSYGIGETITILVPGAYGGGSGSRVNGGEFGEETKVAKTVAEKTGMGEEQAKEFARQLPAYWGPQPGTSGPVYLGAIVCFLFIAGLVYVNSWHKWWIIAASIIGVFLAWGKNFSSLNYFLFDYLPLYNKFRAPSMGLVMPQLCFPLLAALGLQQMLDTSVPTAARWKKFKTTCTAAGVIILLLGAFYFMADYGNANDAALKNQLSQMMLSGQQQPTPEMQQQAGNFGQSVISSLRDDRQALFGKDLLRSVFFILLAAGLIYFYIKGKIKAAVLLIGVLAVSTIDLLIVDSRYLGYKNYIEKDEFEGAFQPNAADLSILKDTKKPFRVYDQGHGENPFENARASYFHNSVGGYSPAKLGLYQDLIQEQLLKGNMQVYNMLNTRYFINTNPSNNEAMAQLNPAAFGPAWFVKEIKPVKDGNEEMKALDSTYLKDVAVIQQKYLATAGNPPAFDSAATIQVQEYDNDKIVYKTNATGNQFAVFSEIYYDKGWNVYIDGKPSSYTKVNYVLRGMQVPAGAHTIEFRFEPKSVAISKIITTVCALLVYFLLAVLLYRYWKQQKNAAITISAA
jgi:hypothetical protein